jgi:hypothetical protein
MIEVLYVLWTVLVAESFLSSTHSREKDATISNILSSGPGVSNVLEMERYLYDSINPVVGFRPISEFCQDGELWSLRFLFPAAAA